MSLFRFFLTALTIITSCAASSSYALDLYVDKKTKQIFAEPGPGRVHMGTYENPEALLQNLLHQARKKRR